MHIEFLQRHLAVASREGAAQMLRTDRKFWNVISICGPTAVPLNLTHAAQIHMMRFEDIETANDASAVCVPRAADIAAAFEFADRTFPGPLLVHCQMGLSRSTAVALVLLVRKLWPAADAFTLAAEALLEIRPQARPNTLIAKLGFEHFMPPAEAVRLSRAVVYDPRFVANRSASTSSSELE